MPSPTRKATPAKKKPTPRAKAAKTPAKKKVTPKPKPAAAAAPPAKKSSARAAKALPTAPLPPVHRGIFIDVENTSNEEALSRVIDALDINRAAQPTDLFAVGNWRAIGQTMSRRLARLGATLVHSAPVTGVRDWSDLWIAVAAGRWIANAKPGDILEIVSNDKAFEAVGDVAATEGVVFRRVLLRAGSSASSASAAAADTDDEGKPRRRRRRGGRGRRRPSSAAHSERAAAAPHAERSSPSAHRSSPRSEPAPKPAPPPRPAPAPKEEAGGADGHTASHDQVLETIRRLTGGDPARWVNLDVIANALKAEGFTRPPGSPRLVVRLRRMKDIEVQPNGMVRVTG